MMLEYLGTQHAGMLLTTRSQPSAALPDRCGAGQLRPAWTTLLGALDRALLTTHRSKFTQFLLWFVAQQVRV